MRAVEIALKAMVVYLYIVALIIIGFLTFVSVPWSLAMLVLWPPLLVLGWVFYRLIREDLSK